MSASARVPSYKVSPHQTYVQIYIHTIITIRQHKLTLRSFILSVCCCVVAYIYLYTHIYVNKFKYIIKCMHLLLQLTDLGESFVAVTYTNKTHNNTVILSFTMVDPVESHLRLHTEQLLIHSPFLYN